MEVSVNNVLRTVQFCDKYSLLKALNGLNYGAKHGFQAVFKEKPKEPKRYPVGKLKIAIVPKILENDPDSKLPWEFQPSASKDSKADDKVGKSKEKMKPVKELKIISGAPPVTSVEAEVHSSSSGDKEGSQNNSEEEYNSEDEDPGADEWGDLATVAPANKIN